MEKNKPEIRVSQKASNAGNWWVTFKDGSLAWPRPLSSRAQAREIARQLRLGNDGQGVDNPEAPPPAPLYDLTGNA